LLNVTLKLRILKSLREGHYGIVNVGDDIPPKIGKIALGLEVGLF
jgi:hypothetical protein